MCNQQIEVRITHDTSRPAELALTLRRSIGEVRLLSGVPLDKDLLLRINSFGQYHEALHRSVR
jgi:hypothetical protein